MKMEHVSSIILPVWSQDYARFLADMGERPDDTVLTRADAAKPFGPGNCRWLPVASRSVRATIGWMKRRDYLPISSAGLRASTNQSKSVPLAAATMRASMPR